MIWIDHSLTIPQEFGHFDYRYRSLHIFYLDHSSHHTTEDSRDHTQSFSISPKPFTQKEGKGPWLLRGYFLFIYINLQAYYLIMTWNDDRLQVTM